MKKMHCLVPGCLLACLSGTVAADDDVELVNYMRTLQYFAHKTSLAIDADNVPLVAFYAHEMEEAVEELEDIDSYDDYPIAKLTESLLEPAFERFEDSVESGKTAEISHRFDDVVKACNSCHEETSHGFIRIQRISSNPFMQSFEKTDGK